MKVLVAEDHEVNLKMICFMLEKMNCQVLKARNGLEAVEIFSHEPPDLVLMDLRMPEMDGCDAVREIRRIEAEKGWTRRPISALSANSSQTDRLEASNAGMDFFITKPFKIEDLSHILSGIGCHEEKTPGKSVFDIEDLLSMFGGDGETLKPLLKDFLAGVPEIMGRLKQYAETEDYSSVDRTAHTLKGQLLNIRANEASEAAASLERAGKDGDKKATKQALARCEASMAVLIEKINDYLTT